MARNGTRTKGGRECRRRSAFTLIELLVVIAIIGTLMSLLLPALSRAKEKGRRAICQSNLHQWHLGMEQYANDFEGWYPVRVLWGNHDMFRSSQAWEVAMLTTMAKEFVHPATMFCPSFKRGTNGAANWWFNRGGVQRPVPGGYWAQTAYWLLVGAGNHPSFVDALLKPKGPNWGCPYDGGRGHVVNSRQPNLRPRTPMLIDRSWARNGSDRAYWYADAGRRSNHELEPPTPRGAQGVTYAEGAHCLTYDGSVTWMSHNGTDGPPVYYHRCYYEYYYVTRQIYP